MTKEEKKTKNQEKRAAKKSALTACSVFVIEHSEDTELLAQALLIKPGTRMATRATSKDVIAELFQEQGTVTEDEIWSEHKLGRAEMRKIRVNLIKKSAPANRIWIDFNAEEGTYDLVAEGPEAPEGWTGYRPVDVEDIDL